MNEFFDDFDIADISDSDMIDELEKRHHGVFVATTLHEYYYLEAFKKLREKYTIAELEKLL